MIDEPCPDCGGELEVPDVRPYFTDDYNYPDHCICLDCGGRFPIEHDCELDENGWHTSYNLKE